MVSEWWVDPSQPIERIDTDAELHAAALLVAQFRTGFQDPLNRVSMGVRSFVNSEGAPTVVTQRLKRLTTIVGKLARIPGMNLARMQDIGGCRAIVPTQAQAERVLRRIRKNSDVTRVDDYATEPKATGYRAIHAVVRRRGRLIEIQLRTPLQQRWAAEVDRAGGLLGVVLKDGQGPPELVAAFAELAGRIALTGDAPGQADVEGEFQAIRAQVRGHLTTK